MQRPWWWILIFYIPIVGPILMVVFLVDFMRLYNRKSFLDGLLIIILNVLYIAYFNYHPKTQFVGVEERKETFISSILFAIIFASTIHHYLIQPYAIPTSSMERTLLVGDFLFVSKINYGLRIPFTPVGLPFLQSKIPLTHKHGHKQWNSYVDAIRLPYMRLPKLEEVERYDIVVFNFPTDSVHTAIDRKDPYVKRCLGMPGDYIQFKKGRAFINGKPEELPADAERQFAYWVTTTGPILNKRISKLFGFLDYELQTTNGDQYYYIFKGIPEKRLDDFKSISNVVDVKEYLMPEGEKDIKQFGSKIDTINSIFPVDRNWNADFYGPLYIPKKGDILKLNKGNITQYIDLIRKYENNSLVIKGDSIYINGKLSNTYKVKQDYYFMIGDNRDNSLDSRFFGFVPEDHILGKPVFIWFSVQGVFDNGDFNIRWKRMFKVPNTGNPNSTWYLPYFLALLAAYFIVNYVRKKRRKEAAETN